MMQSEVMQANGSFAVETPAAMGPGEPLFMGAPLPMDPAMGGMPGGMALHMGAAPPMFLGAGMHPGAPPGAAPGHPAGVPAAGYGAAPVGVLMGNGPRGAAPMPPQGSNGTFDHKCCPVGMDCLLACFGLHWVVVKTNHDRVPTYNTKPDRSFDFFLHTLFFRAPPSPGE